MSRWPGDEECRGGLGRRNVVVGLGRSGAGYTEICRSVCTQYGPQTYIAHLSYSAALPEGFFDDPKMDAKARKVEYKDPMTEEWEKFQKSIAKETDVCFMLGGCVLTRMNLPL